MKKITIEQNRKIIKYQKANIKKFILKDYIIIFIYLNFYFFNEN